MIEIKCQQCKRGFASNDVRRKFCSTDCGYENKRRRVTYNCEQCGKEVTRRKHDYERAKHHFCSNACSWKWSSENIRGEKHHMCGKTFSEKHRRKMGQSVMGNKNSNWKGGKKLQNGYVRVKHDGKYHAEHRLVVEKALGRPLTQKEVVHHLDGNRTNNRNDNLLVCTKPYHQWLERIMSSLYKLEHFCKDFTQVDAFLLKRIKGLQT